MRRIEMKDSKLKRKLVFLYEKWLEYKLKHDDFCLKKKIGTPQILTIDETLNYLLDHKCSISRFGDGELKIASGLSIRFQEYDGQLSQRLREILKSSSPECLVCLTDIFYDINWMKTKSYEYSWRIMAEHRQEWTDMLDLNKVYGNTNITRFYMDRSNKDNSERWFNQLKRIWENQKIVLVEGEKSRLGYHNDLFKDVVSIERILCPAKNAYSYYNQILDEVKKIDKNKLILIALGPTASVLAYDLSILGYHALDVGHVDIEYEWFLQKATEKVKIEGKYTNEALNGDQVSDEVDDEYEGQIISRIGCDMEE